MRRIGLGCGSWLAPAATRRSSINNYQEGNGARGQIQRTKVTAVDLEGPKITAVLG